MFAKSYVTQLSDNVKRGIEQKRINGEWSGLAPFGYKNTEVLEGGGKKWIAPDKATEHIVRDMYNRYASGAYSMKTLRKYLQAQQGITLATSQIDRILKNTFYYGVMRVNGEYYPHNYEPLVSKDLFDQVQSIKMGSKKQSISMRDYLIIIVDSSHVPTVDALSRLKNLKDIFIITAPNIEASTVHVMCEKKRLLNRSQ